MAHCKLKIALFTPFSICMVGVRKMVKSVSSGLGRALAPADQPK
jgi:hypothetical protein